MEVIHDPELDRRQVGPGPLQPQAGFASGPLVAKLGAALGLDPGRDAGQGGLRGPGGGVERQALFPGRRELRVQGGGLPLQPLTLVRQGGNLTVERRGPLGPGGELVPERLALGRQGCLPAALGPEALF